MKFVQNLKEKVLSGGYINKDEALQLANADLEALCSAADEIRSVFCQNGFDICTIINGKSGKCTENCKYCAQAGCHATSAAEYPLLETKQLLEEARHNEKQGVLRYSIVTSGRRLSPKEVELACESIKTIKHETNIEVCASFGLLEEEDFKKLKEAGVSRIHNNLESSRRYFPEVCTTHTYRDKITAIQAAQKAGLSVCSGGIMGIGETMEDRIDMALELRALEIRSVPVNMLNPIPGTPLADQKILSEDEMRRIIAIYRFILPQASIRMAGGRGLLEDKGMKCFQSGANAAISGDMLTTSGITVAKDLEMLEQLGYVPRLSE
ncbi:MAG: biotin synthase BioB [Lachnospiraceae bacterium]|jgi:biotin synthase|nr:biotin synthase BioB [Lachnospiraceae bacterium]